MTSHSSTLAWKIPWTEEPGGLQSMGSLRVGHDWATSLSLFTFMHQRRKWQPTPVFLPGESQGRGSLVYGVAQSRTQLKWLSSIPLHHLPFSIPNSSVLSSVQWADEAALWPNPPEQVTPSVWGVQVALDWYGPIEMEYKSLGNFKLLVATCKKTENKNKWNV